MCMCLQKCACVWYTAGSVEVGVSHFAVGSSVRLCLDVWCDCVSVRIRVSVRRIGRYGETGPSELRMWRDVNDIVREGMVREGSGRQEAVMEVIRMGGNGER